MKNARPQISETSALEQRHFNPPDDLFPENLSPVVSAVWPNPGTLTADVLDVLLTRPVNQAEYKRSWRLAAYVGQLDKRGWRITRRDVTRPGHRSPITEYTLDRSDPRTATAIASRQHGGIDPPLAGLLAFAVTCAVLLSSFPATIS